MLSCGVVKYIRVVFFVGFVESGVCVFNVLKIVDERKLVKNFIFVFNGDIWIGWDDLLKMKVR